jgi:VanZ family protein
VASALCAGLIAVGAVVRIPPGPAPTWIDKAVHLCEYLLLAWLLAQTVRAARWPRRSVAGFAAGASVAYGALLEVVQGFLPYRMADVQDLGMNTLGTALGVILAMCWNRP